MAPEKKQPLVRKQTTEIKRQNKYIYKAQKFLKEYGTLALFAFGSVFLVAFLGGLFARTDTPWFIGLIKPQFYPPNALFGIMWTILYILIAIGLMSVIKNKPSRKITFLYVMNGIFNIVWNLVFFTLQSAAGGVVVLVVLIVFAYLLLLELFKFNKLAFWFTLPYFIWLLFAFLLNYSIYFLN